MNGWRRITALALVAFYAGTGILVESLHNDGVAHSLIPGPRFARHDCGEREIHIPLDMARTCALCAQSSQRVSLPLPERPPAPLLRVVIGVLPAGPNEIPSTLFSHLDSRGPPAA